jgi:hypothetical protein
MDQSEQLTEEPKPEPITCVGSVKLNLGALFGGQPEQEEEDNGE